MVGQNQRLQMTKYDPLFLVLKAKPGTWADQRIAKDPASSVSSAANMSTFPTRATSTKLRTLQKWEQRVLHAADRLATGYPLLPGALCRSISLNRGCH